MIILIKQFEMPTFSFFFLLCSIGNSLMPLSFYGEIYLHINNYMESSKFEMDLKFYNLSRDQSKSNKYVLTYINTASENIINIQNQDDFLYVFGNINIRDSKSIKFKRKYISVLGVYNTKSHRIFLAHSLNRFLKNEIISKYVKNPCLHTIDYEHNLFSFLFKIKRIFNEIKCKEPLGSDQKMIKTLFIENIQLAAMKVYSYEESNFPFIYLKVILNNHLYKTFYFDLNAEGYLDTDMSFYLSEKYYNIVSLIEIHTTQINKVACTKATRKYSSFIILFFIIYCAIYLVFGKKVKFSSYFEYFFVILYDFIYVAKENNDANHPLAFVTTIIQYSKMIEILFLSTYLLHNFWMFSIYSFITLAILCYFPFGNRIYSFNIMFLCFSNLIPRIIYVIMNETDIKTSYLMIIFTLVRRVEANLYFTYFLNDIYKEHNDTKIMIYIYFWIIFQCLFLLLIHYAKK